MIIHTNIQLPIGKIVGPDNIINNSITAPNNKKYYNITFLVLREATREEYFKQLEEMGIKKVSDELEPYTYEISID